MSPTGRAGHKPAAGLTEYSSQQNKPSTKLFLSIVFGCMKADSGVHIFSGFFVICKIRKIDFRISSDFLMPSLSGAGPVSSWLSCAALPTGLPYAAHRMCSRRNSFAGRLTASIGFFVVFYLRSISHEFDILCKVHGTEFLIDTYDHIQLSYLI